MSPIHSVEFDQVQDTYFLLYAGLKNMQWFAKIDDQFWNILFNQHKIGSVAVSLLTKLENKCC